MADDPSPDVSTTLRRRVELVPLVERATTLRRKGQRHHGRCPSCGHEQLVVNNESSLFHCFGCGSGGDVIAWVMITQGVSFPEAVRSLAAEYGDPP